MDATAVEQEIYNAIRRVKPSLETMALTPQTRFDELGLESLERTVVLFEIEDVYAISIVEQNLDTFETIAQARDLIAKLIGKAASQGARSGGRTA